MPYIIQIRCDLYDGGMDEKNINHNGFGTSLHVGTGRRTGVCQ
jgi:hypothetical protein